MKVHKVGGSLMLTIPAAVARRLAIADGAVLDMEEHEGELIIRPKNAMRRFFESWEPLRFNGPAPTTAEIVEEIRRDREEME